MGKSPDMPEDEGDLRPILKELRDERDFSSLVPGAGLWPQPGLATESDVVRVQAGGAGAEAAVQELAPAQLLVFGNPKLGTPAMQDDPLAGLYLPLKVLVYQDGDGTVWLAHEDPGEMLDDLDGIGKDAGYIEKMRGALSGLTAKAAGG